MIDLSNNKIGDKGCAIIANLFTTLPAIDMLNLTSNKVMFLLYQTLIGSFDDSLIHSSDFRRWNQPLAVQITRWFMHDRFTQSGKQQSGN